eukprot:Colp12_sorted_trinity150504_noHs@32581
MRTHARPSGSLSQCSQNGHGHNPQKKTQAYLVVDGDSGISAVEGGGVTHAVAEGQVHGVGVGELGQLPGGAGIGGVVVVAVKGAALLGAAGDPGLGGGEHAGAHQGGAGGGSEHGLPVGAGVGGGHSQGTLLVLSDSDAVGSVEAVDFVEVELALTVEHLSPGGTGVGGLGDGTGVAGHRVGLGGLEVSAELLQVHAGRQLVGALAGLLGGGRPGAGGHVPGVGGGEGSVASDVGGVQSDVVDVPGSAGVGGDSNAVGLLLGGLLLEGASGAQGRRTKGLDVLRNTDDVRDLREGLSVLSQKDTADGGHGTGLSVGGEGDVHVHATSRANVLTGLKGVSGVHKARAKGVVGHGAENLGGRDGRDTSQGGDLDVGGSPSSSQSNTEGGEDGNKVHESHDFYKG